MKANSADDRDYLELPYGIRCSELVSLSSPQKRAEYLDQHRELASTEAVSMLAALVPQLAKKDRHVALATAEFASAIAHRLRDSESIARSLRAKGNVHYALGQNKTALEHHRKALRLFRMLGDREQVARTLSSSIQPLILQGQYQAALAAAREARRIFAQQGNRWRIARLDLNVGNIFDRQDRFDQALKCYERAYQFLSARDQDDPEAVAVALHNIAVAHLSLNDFRRAKETYEDARMFAQAHQMKVLVAQADYNIAWLYYLRGHYQRAIAMLQAARNSCADAGDDYHLALCHLDLSEIYLELKLTVEAADSAEQASAAFGRLGMNYEKAKSILNLGVATARQGKISQALELFDRSRRMFAREGNSVLPSLVDLYRSQLLASVDRHKDARRTCDAALRTFQKYRVDSKVVACRLLLARTCLGQGDVRAARRQSSLALRRLASLNIPALQCEAHTLQGNIQAVAGQERLSRRSYLRARDYLEALRNNIRSEELKISFLKGRIEIYEALVVLQLKHLTRTSVREEIFEYIQLAKSRSLVEVLSSPWETQKLVEQEDEPRVSRVHLLREELNWYAHKLDSLELQPENRQQANEIRAQYRRRETQLLRLTRECVSQGEDAGTNKPTIGIDEIRTFLPPDAAILEYFRAQDEVIVAVLTHTGLHIVPLGHVPRISQLTEFLRLQLSKLGLGPAYVATFSQLLLRTTQTHLRDLYKILIEPIRQFLTASHLVIAPHGFLHNIPFQALYDGEKYVVDTFTVSYAPSATVYARCEARTASSENGSLILGIPDDAVPFVENEVEAVARCFPKPEVLLGENASTENLRQKGRNSRFIHIATHGRFRRDNPMFSAIRLGDSYLTLYDLYQMKLRAELVTLSGCSTGLGVVSAGDESLGLARGLIHAGAESSMLTQWDVQDQSSAGLMTFFYTQLAGGRRKATALQQAMCELKSIDPHPFHWAPFILVGKTK